MIKFLTLKIVNFFDFFHKMKIINFLKKNKKTINVVFDVGGHHGESIELFCNKLNVNQIYTFEPIKSNFEKLLITKQKIKHKKNIDIISENFACGKEDKLLEINKLSESSSSTLKKINLDSKYFKRKSFFLNIKNELDSVSQITLKNYFNKKKIQEVDLLKIDTEGSEFDVIVGLDSAICKIKYILFEHHYDNMIIKGYNFSEIHNYLVEKNFYQIFKSKMFFRKTFEYIYLNAKYD